MDNIDSIIDSILEAEGSRFTNHQADKGGPTKFGITLETFNNYYGTNHDEYEGSIAVSLLTRERAVEIYKKDYYIKPNFCALPVGLQALVTDTGVLHGVSKAAKFVQAACGAKEDGIIGPKTIVRIELHPVSQMFNNVLSRRIKHYGEIVTHDPTQVVFLNGWLNRALKFLE